MSTPACRKGKDMENVGTQNRREYYRQWRANNKDRIREYNARYWAKRAARLAQERTDGKEARDDGSR